MQQQQIKSKAMRAAGIGCVFMLGLIGLFSFLMSTQQLIDSVRWIGELFGQGTTVGLVVLASLPPLAGVIAYYFCKWVLK